jgi:hypothetical protein
MCMRRDSARRLGGNSDDGSLGCDALGGSLWCTAYEGAGTGCRITRAMVASGHPWGGPE